MIEHTLEQPKTTTPRTKGAQNTRSIRGVNYTKEGFELVARIFFFDLCDRGNCSRPVNYIIYDFEGHTGFGRGWYKGIAF